MMTWCTGLYLQSEHAVELSLSDTVSTDRPTTMTSRKSSDTDSTLHGIKQATLQTAWHYVKPTTAVDKITQINENVLNKSINIARCMKTHSAKIKQPQSFTSTLDSPAMRSAEEMDQLHYIAHACFIQQTTETRAEFCHRVQNKGI